jgi:hypothetical protein
MKAVIRDTYRLSRRSRGCCALCYERATVEVHVQVSRFRGDDVVARLCESHQHATPDTVLAASGA